MFTGLELKEQCVREEAVARALRRQVAKKYRTQLTPNNLQQDFMAATTEVADSAILDLKLFILAGLPGGAGAHLR